MSENRSDLGENQTNALVAEVEKLPGIGVEQLSLSGRTLLKIPSWFRGVIARTSSSDGNYEQTLHAVIVSRGNTYGLVTLGRLDTVDPEELTGVYDYREDMRLPQPEVRNLNEVRALIKINDGEAEVSGIISGYNTVIGTDENSESSDGHQELFAVQTIDEDTFIMNLDTGGSTTVLSAAERYRASDPLTDTYPSGLLISLANIDNALSIRERMVAIRANRMIEQRPGQ